MFELSTDLFCQDPEYIGYKLAWTLAMNSVTFRQESGTSMAESTIHMMASEPWRLLLTMKFETA